MKQINDIYLILYPEERKIKTNTHADDIEDINWWSSIAEKFLDEPPKGFEPLTC